MNGNRWPVMRRGGARHFASYVHRRAVLRIVDAMRREPEHGRFAVDVPGCDEKRLSAFHGFHINVRRETIAPRFDHVGE
jgi:hypothetical protein